VDLFFDQNLNTDTVLADGAHLLAGFATSQAQPLALDIQHLLKHSPLRFLTTPGGKTMSVAMSNCGPWGWHSDRRGYRYLQMDPQTQQPWPSMPKSFYQLAARAAAKAGFRHYRPDACLINRYAIGSRLSLHQDRDEQDKRSPIVSVSLGLPAIFLFGGIQREQACTKLLLQNGDVMVWGGDSRLNFHGVQPLAEGYHPLTGNYRFNLTFRKVLA